MPAAAVADGATGFAASNTNAAIAISNPAGLMLGDVLLFIGWCRLITATVSTAPAGFTLLSTFTSGTASGGRIWIYGRIVDGTEPGTVNFATNGVTGNSGDLWGACIYAYRGIDTSGGITAIYDGTPTTTDASGTTTCTYPALTISNADSMIVRTLARFQDLAVTFTPTATWSEREDSSSTVRTGAQHHLQDKLATASGVQAAVTVTPSSTTATRYLAVTFALKATQPPKQTTTSEISLASAMPPVTRTLHSVKARARITNGAHSGKLRVRLYEGGTARSAIIESSALTTSFAEYTFVISDAEAAAITSYADLSLRIFGYSASGTPAVFEVSQVWLEIPGTSITAFPSTSVVDNFTRANQYPPGGNWLGSTQSNGLQVVSNTLKNVAGSPDTIYWNASPTTDQEGYVTFTAFPTANYPIDIHLRRDHAANTAYVVRLSPAPGAQTISIYKRITGTDTQIGATISGITFAAGDSFGVRIVGSSIEVWRKPSGGAWTYIDSRTDTGITAAGRIGLAFYGVEWAIDDFGGPALPSTPIASSDTNGTTTEGASVTTKQDVSGTDINGTTTEIATLVAILPTTVDVNGTTTDTAVLVAKPITADVNGVVTEGTTLTVPPVPIAASDVNGATTETVTLLAKPSTTDVNGVTTESVALVARPITSDVNGVVTEGSSATQSITPKADSDVNGTVTESVTVVARIGEVGAAPSYVSEVLADNPISYWRLGNNVTIHDEKGVSARCDSGWRLDRRWPAHRRCRYFHTVRWCRRFHRDPEHCRSYRL